MRLLFGREFNLHDLLILWDAIFGVGENLSLTYYIVVAMLIHIRNERESIFNFYLQSVFDKFYIFTVLKRDYTDCLTLLMKYPRSDISVIIRHALHVSMNNLLANNE